MKIPFYKYQGAGNDFVILDQREQVFVKKDAQRIISRICDRKFGIGADGLIILGNSSGADFSMDYFNADGRPSSMCGNGGRCIVSLASKINVIQSQKCIFEAVDGQHEATLLIDDLVSLKMNDVQHIKEDRGDFILDTGSPHFVRFEQNLELLDVEKEAKKIRYSEEFSSQGINVNFIRENDHQLEIRTYERGVEAETLACGTGVTAAALVAAARNGMSTGSYDVKARGGKLTVSYERDGSGFKNIWLTGPAVFVFEGVIEIE